ncbi:hypothetical protein BDW74DRAFT_103657 [Aspergillus multicolor]|uniref:uncharacterized protein n=1 Tax=Aspergillus multicolor TaxID=41759 RepID=UPI003CCCF583
MPFHPSYVQQGFNGGRALIRQFKNRVRAYVEELIPMNRTMRRRSQINDLDIIIRVYSNVQDLGKVYCENEHISSESVFHDFIRGFNTSASCDFTDAGAGLDKADRKVIYQFRDAFLDFHCHHVLFCGASDTGYFDMLRKAKNQTSRLTLVEAVPFPALIQPFKEVFDIAQFPDIFLSKPLDHKRLPTLDRSYLKYEPHAVDGSTPETPPRPGSSEDRLAAIESSLAEMINLLQEPRSHTHQSAGHLSTINPDPLADFARPSGNLDEGLHYQSSSHREPVGDIYSADIRDEHGQGIKMETDTPRESEPAPSPGNSSEDPESQTPIDPQESTNEAAQPEHADADADADGQTDPLQKLADKRELLLKYIDRLNASLLKIVEFHGDENEYLHSQARRRLGDNRDWKRLSAKFKTLSNDPVLAEMNLCRTAGLIHVRLENLISTLKDANEEIYDQFIRSNHAIQVTTSQLRDFATTYRRSSWHAFNKQASKAIRKTRHG